MSAPGTLAVFVDGEALPEDAARAFWQRFSVYLDQHRGDLAGFAQSEGLASVHPEMRATGAALVASRTAAQRPYANASAEPARSSAGSVAGRGAGASSRGRTGKRR